MRAFLRPARPAADVDRDRFLPPFTVSRAGCRVPSRPASAVIVAQLMTVPSTHPTTAGTDTIAR